MSPRVSTNAARCPTCGGRDRATRYGPKGGTWSKNPCRDRWHDVIDAQLAFDTADLAGNTTVDLAPNRVRRDDWATSRAGAASVAFRAGSQKALLLDAYQAAGAAGLTDEEAAEAAGVPERSCWWKRCNELRDSGAIVPNGTQRPGRAGVPRIVCVIGEVASGDAA